MLYLVDTGVWLRLFDRADRRNQAIREALRLLRARRDTLAVTPQNLAEFWNVSTRPSSARGGYGLPASVAAMRVQFIERWAMLISETQASVAQWKRLVVDHGVSGVAAHDARLVAVMITAGIRRILTLNDADFRRYPEVECATPEALVAEIGDKTKRSSK